MAAETLVIKGIRANGMMFSLSMRVADVCVSCVLSYNEKRYCCTLVRNTVVLRRYCVCNPPKRSGNGCTHLVNYKYNNLLCSVIIWFELKM